MSWEVYRLIYQAKAPMHVGYHKIGFIQRTRYYITGRNMWGAIAANLARSLEFDAMKTVQRSCKTPLEQHYENIGISLLNKDILISYFYPTTNSEKPHPILPRFEPTGLKYGEYPNEEFERLFIRSFGQTAIEPANNTAEEGSLHETEYIAPSVELNGDQKEVYFVGYIFMKGKINYQNKSVGFDEGDIKIKEAIRELFVGGERKYGFGRLVLSDKSKKIKDKNPCMFGNQLILDNDKYVKVKIEKETPIPAHLDIEVKACMKGDIEPIVGREWGEIKDSEGKSIIGPGQKVSGAKICWMPGSILLERKEFSLGSFGILTP